MTDFGSEPSPESRTFDGRMHIGDSTLRVALVITPEEPPDGASEADLAAYGALQDHLARLSTAEAVQLELTPYTETPELPPGATLVEVDGKKVPAITARSLASHMETMDTYANANFSRRAQIAAMAWSRISRNIVSSRGLQASPWQRLLEGSDTLPQLTFGNEDRLQYVPAAAFSEFARAAVASNAVGPSGQRILGSLVQSLEEAGLIQSNSQERDERN